MTTDHLPHERRSEPDPKRLIKDLSDIKFALDQSAIVATTDAAGKITYVNEKFREISQYSSDELLGQDHRIINSQHHPKEFLSELWGTISRGEIWQGEIRNRAKDGSIYWVATTIVPFLDADGQPYQYMAVRFDITERKRAEAKLLEQQTLARLGEMSAVVAHEIRNPLAGISGALQVIGSRLDPESGDRAVIGDIQKRIESLNDMVQDLLLFARPQALSRSATAIGTLAQDVATAMSQDPILADVDVRITGDNPQVNLDRDQVRIVLQNLLLNAAQATDGAGSVEVDVTAKAETCEITVADDGSGLAPAIAKQIFEPFFTTKHRGSGLGLPTAKRIVEAHGGTLEARNREPRGVVVTVSLPSSPPERGGGTARTS